MPLDIPDAPAGGEPNAPTLMGEFLCGCAAGVGSSETESLRRRQRRRPRRAVEVRLRVLRVVPLRLVKGGVGRAIARAVAALRHLALRGSGGTLMLKALVAGCLLLEHGLAAAEHRQEAPQAVPGAGRRDLP
eukprot:CAMPEP_0170401636 /NCGR_PEP_ID=MMETSP0117_2-20130122/25127_1 /TAXON_ID=400756 /ORGANISM="Durinskia baltica, Strain CSIRO CS-38" /LENGTH=131 /DNA_ID=CAMNT_0010658445 /DNA_START=11 /DNA_END=403 /DNA_ORIENTATION=+